MKLSNTELILLILINDYNEISGYQLNSNIKKYGYREWAGIGTTSIYVGLKNIKKKGFATSELDLKKSTKGPVGKLYTITQSGIETLKQEISSGLSETREHDNRFKIAISGMDFLQKIEILDLLSKRIQFLEKEYTRVKNIFESQKSEMIFKAEVLFTHTFSSIKNEINFTQQLSEKLQQQEDIKW